MCQSRIDVRAERLKPCDRSRDGNNQRSERKVAPAFAATARWGEQRRSVQRKQVAARALHQKLRVILPKGAILSLRIVHHEAIGDDSGRGVREP